MTNTETIETCKGSSSKHTESNCSSWKCWITMWIQDGNTALDTKLVELLYMSVKSPNRQETEALIADLYYNQNITWISWKLQ
jgi:hypothetical protein